MTESRMIVIQECNRNKIERYLKRKRYGVEVVRGDRVGSTELK